MMATYFARSALYAWLVKIPTQRHGLAGLAADVFAFLNSDGVSKRRIEFRERQILFSQGEPAKNILYIQAGSVKVAVSSAAGKEAVVALLGPGDFLGEGCLAGQPAADGDRDADDSGQRPGD